MALIINQYYVHRIYLYCSIRLYIIINRIVYTRDYNIIRPLDRRKSLTVKTVIYRKRKKML